MRRQNRTVVQIWPYTLLFVVAYAAISIVGLLIGYLVGETSTAALGLIAPMLAACFTSNKFVNFHRRPPDREEAKKLTRQALMVWLFYSVVGSTAFIVSGGGDNIAPDIATSRSVMVVSTILILPVFSLITWLQLRWSFRGLARKAAKRRGFA